LLVAEMTLKLASENAGAGHLAVSKKTMEDRREVLERAQRLVALIPERRPSEKTALEYRRCVKRMLRTPGPVQVLRPGDSMDYYYGRRAALHYVAGYVLRMGLEEAAAAEAHGDVDGVLIRKLAEFLDRVEAAIELDRPEPAPRAHLDAGRPSLWSDGPRRRSSGSAKRKVLSRLPADWRERLWNVLPSTSPYRNAIAILLLVGPRPAEFVAGARNGIWSPGITVTLTSEGLRIRIDGAKCGDGSRGQPVRILTLSVSEGTEPAARLADACIRNGGEIVVSATSGDALRKAVERAGRKAFPRLKAAITPYVLRHAFVSDLKATFSDPATIAAAAGQQSDATQSIYGIRLRGRRRTDIAEVFGSQAVRRTGKARLGDRLGRSAKPMSNDDPEGAEEPAYRYEPND
jgi:integrase